MQVGSMFFFHFCLAAAWCHSLAALLATRAGRKQVLTKKGADQIQWWNWDTPIFHWTKIVGGRRKWFLDRIDGTDVGCFCSQMSKEQIRRSPKTTSQVPEMLRSVGLGCIFWGFGRMETWTYTVKLASIPAWKIIELIFLTTFKRMCVVSWKCWTCFNNLRYVFFQATFLKNPMMQAITAERWIKFISIEDSDSQKATPKKDW